MDDPAGFRLAVPDGWVRSEHGGQIDYSPDDGTHVLRIGVTPAAPKSPEAHFLELEQSVSGQADYTRISLAANVYQDREGALWEFTSTDPGLGPRHTADQAFIAPDGTEYAVLVASPPEDWSTVQQQFETVLSTFTVA
ncbi:hypothetical protein [Kitasatospora sp. MBT63]|uniref:hypothetical protein n=1 Tax=Kitasatospora sp. MBT63 TaxID=1444768 RepID=UPI0019D71573|nr:hypothetical protein [Kitasatospora sp. MBT63]